MLWLALLPLVGLIASSATSAIYYDSTYERIPFAPDGPGKDETKFSSVNAQMDHAHRISSIYWWVVVAAGVVAIVVVTELGYRAARTLRVTEAIVVGLLIMGMLLLLPTSRYPWWSSKGSLEQLLRDSYAHAAAARFWKYTAYACIAGAVAAGAANWTRWLNEWSAGSNHPDVKLDLGSSLQPKT